MNDMCLKLPKLLALWIFATYAKEISYIAYRCAGRCWEVEGHCFL